MLAPCGSLALPAASAGPLCLAPRISSLLPRHSLRPHQSRPLLFPAAHRHSLAALSTSSPALRGPAGPGQAAEGGGRAGARPGAVRMSAVSGAAASGAQAAEDDVIPGVVVGAGRVGSALARMAGGCDVVVRRGEIIPGGSAGPILVCTRNDALDSVVDQTPESRREDLVFFQNGMLDPWLASRGLADATQVLVYFAVAKLGDAPIDGVTDLNPEGLTAACGKWAGAVAARLRAAGLSCKVLGREEFEKPMLEKLIWISAFMLVGVRNANASIGDVESKYRHEVSQLIEELAAATCLHMRQQPGREGFAFDAGLVERLCAYARSVAHYPTAIKEMDWRNGWFVKIAEDAVARGLPDPCPLHSAWLKEVGALK